MPWTVYGVLTLLLQAVLCLAAVVFALRTDWENAFLTALVILVTLLPTIAWRGYRVFIPAEVQLVSAVFVFVSLFLGSALDWYYDYWWWDLLLHSASGFLLGIAGFIAVFALNRRDSLPRGMRPIFVCFFGVTFAVSFGVVWEIFEFLMDRLVPSLNMQSGETGVVDTMEDLTVNLAAAVVTGFAGWMYLRRKARGGDGRRYIIEVVRTIIRKNPWLFRRSRRRAG